MTHQSASPSVRLPIRQRLSFRQARTAVFLGLGVGLLLGMVQVTFDLFKERQRIQSNIAQVLKVVRDSAGQASYQKDPLQAEKVLTGLFNCQAIRHASLTTANGSPLLQKQRPSTENALSLWVTSLLLPMDTPFSTPLRFDDQPAGNLTISVNAFVSANDFLLRAGFTLLGSLLQAVLLATILTATFHRLLTRPLLLLGQQLADVDPSQPALRPITVPPDHAEDELGLVARFMNRALGSFEAALQVQKQTDRMLQRTQFSVDHAAEMISWVGPDGRFLYINDAMCQGVEYTREEMLVMTVSDLDPELTPQQWTAHWNALRENKQGRVETVVRTKSGLLLPIEIHITQLELDGQEIHCNFAREIRSRKLAERAIKRANQILRTLSLGNETMIKAASERELLDRICQLIVREGGYRMVWVGFATFDAHKRILPAAQSGFDDGYLDNLDLTWTDTEKGRGPSGRAFRSRKPVISREIQTDPNFAPWRQAAMRRGFVSSLALPLPNDDLQPLGTLNIYSGSPDAFDNEEIQLLENLANNLAFGILKFREAEERRRAEKARQLSEEKLLTLFHHSPDCLMTLDRNGTVQFSNRKGPNNPRELVTEDRIPWLRERLDTVFSTGQAVEYPFTDGESAYWEARLAPILHDGVVTEVLAVCQDVTEKRTLQAQNLRNARLASLGVLSASVAHEINNPNNAIQFNVPILNAIWEDARPILQKAHEGTGAFYLGGMPLAEAMEVIPQLLDGIRMSSQRIQTIIGGLKQMARQDKEILFQRFDIQEPIQSALMILQNQIRLTTDHCHLIPPERPMRVKGNAQQLEQAFINIIQNALHALRNRSQSVTISASPDPDGQHLSLRFADQGRGIATEHLGKLTDPFFTTKTATGGMGLGLSITKTIIDNHGGELHFASRPGQGTTVTVRLPLDAETQTRGEAACPTK